MFARLKSAYARLASGEVETYPPRQVCSADLDQLHSDNTVDITVIGFGGAGATAAIVAKVNGADVAVIDRFYGGGSTKISGGIYYAAP